MKVTLSAAAVGDLRELLQYYEREGELEAGQRRVEEILQAIERLQQFPESGRVVPEFGVAFLREVIHPPYRIVYRRDDERVRVVRVWRSERLLTFPGE